MGDRREATPSRWGGRHDPPGRTPAAAPDESVSWEPLDAARLTSGTPPSPSCVLPGPGNLHPFDRGPSASELWGSGELRFRGHGAFVAEPEAAAASRETVSADFAPWLDAGRRAGSLAGPVAESGPRLARSQGRRGRRSIRRDGSSGHWGTMDLEPGNHWHKVKAFLHPVHLADMLLPVMHPSSPHRVGWDYLMLMVVLYLAVFVPLTISFSRLRVLTWVVALDWICTALMMLDVAVHFRTGYITEHGDLVRDTKLIARRYLTGMFTFDLVSSIPFDAIAGGQTDWAVWLGLFKLLRLVRLVRLLKGSGQIGNPLAMARLVLGLILVAHWCACFWHYLFAAVTQWPWMFSERCPECSDASNYLLAFYSAFLLLLGDKPDAFNNVERVIVTCILFLGTFVYAVVVGTMTLLVANMFSTSTRHKQRSAMVTDALRYTDYLSQWHHPGTEGMAYLKELPPGLYSSLMADLFTPVLIKVQLFAYTEPPFIRRLAEKLRLSMYMAGDVLYEYGSVGHEMYVIWKGAVALMAPGGAMAALQCAGDHFGELGLMTANTPRPHKAVACKNCDIVILSRYDVQEVMRDFPDSAAIVKDVSRSRIEDHDRRSNIWAFALAAYARLSYDEELARLQAIGSDDGSGSACGSGLDERHHHDQDRHGGHRPPGSEAGSNAVLKRKIRQARERELAAQRNVAVGGDDGSSPVGGGDAAISGAWATVRAGPVAEARESGSGASSAAVPAAKGGRAYLMNFLGHNKRKAAAAAATSPKVSPRGGAASAGAAAAAAAPAASPTASADQAAVGATPSGSQVTFAQAPQPRAPQQEVLLAGARSMEHSRATSPAPGLDASFHERSSPAERPSPSRLLSTRIINSLRPRSAAVAPSRRGSGAGANPATADAATAGEGAAEDDEQGQTRALIAAVSALSRRQPSMMVRYQLESTGAHTAAQRQAVSRAVSRATSPTAASMAAHAAATPMATASNRRTTSTGQNGHALGAATATGGRATNTGSRGVSTTSGDQLESQESGNYGALLAGRNSAHKSIDSPDRGRNRNRRASVWLEELLLGDDSQIEDGLASASTRSPMPLRSPLPGSRAAAAARYGGDNSDGDDSDIMLTSPFATGRELDMMGGAGAGAASGRRSVLTSQTGLTTAAQSAKSTQPGAARPQLDSPTSDVWREVHDAAAGYAAWRQAGAGGDFLPPQQRPHHSRRRSTQVSMGAALEGMPSGAPRSPTATQLGLASPHPMHGRPSTAASAAAQVWRTLQELDAAGVDLPASVRAGSNGLGYNNRHGSNAQLALLGAGAGGGGGGGLPTAPSVPAHSHADARRLSIAGLLSLAPPSPSPLPPPPPAAAAPAPAPTVPPASARYRNHASRRSMDAVSFALAAGLLPAQHAPHATPSAPHAAGAEARRLRTSTTGAQPLPSPSPLPTAYRNMRKQSSTGYSRSVFSARSSGYGLYTDPSGASAGAAAAGANGLSLLYEDEVLPGGATDEDDDDDWSSQGSGGQRKRTRTLVARLRAQVAQANARALAAEVRLAGVLGEPLKVPEIAAVVAAEVSSALRRERSNMDGTLTDVRDRLLSIHGRTEELAQAVAAADDRLQRLEDEGEHRHGAGLGVLEGTAELAAMRAGGGPSRSVNGGGGPQSSSGNLPLPLDPSSSFLLATGEYRLRVSGGGGVVAGGSALGGAAGGSVTSGRGSLSGAPVRPLPPGMRAGHFGSVIGPFGSGLSVDMPESRRAGSATSSLGGPGSPLGFGKRQGVNRPSPLAPQGILKTSAPTRAAPTLRAARFRSSVDGIDAVPAGSGAGGAGASGAGAGGGRGAGGGGEGGGGGGAGNGDMQQTPGQRVSDSSRGSSNGGRRSGSFDRAKGGGNLGSPEGNPQGRGSDNGRTEPTALASPPQPGGQHSAPEWRGNGGDDDTNPGGGNGQASGGRNAGPTTAAAAVAAGGGAGAWAAGPPPGGALLREAAEPEITEAPVEAFAPH
ncbi:hypothetical protein HYH03_005347 [Edaphochlamys debaryana]|uniref:Cyclic nucleotide-binding domain-containing protein n=1 Tax=Edaphochlamys debaryana TaxID=47281 RepID=A0A835Y843_9CHLO|nr:hypothetical protein HYH03_005347 [Edaphochlamys debaryana]|eukprot:KAG2496523.1 hypothetical protein HYH03_005347 [Edaphochlamys debaryana]